MIDDRPEEDRHIEAPYTSKRNCQHEYVDLYQAWYYTDKEATDLHLWVFCKKCLDKKKLNFDLSNAYVDEDKL